MRFELVQRVIERRAHRVEPFHFVTNVTARPVSQPNIAPTPRTGKDQSQTATSTRTPWPSMLSSQTLAASKPATARTIPPSSEIASILLISNDLEVRVDAL